MVDLEWNRKTIFEKLDWLKETLEDIITKANHNIDVQQKQILSIVARLSALEKPVREPASARKNTPARKSVPIKKPPRPPVRGTKRQRPLRGKR